MIGDGLFVSDGTLWRERRRAIAPLVHVSRLAELASPMTDAARERAAVWAKAAGHEIDVLGEMAEMTADIICRTIFGSQLGTWRRKRSSGRSASTRR